MDKRVYTALGLMSGTSLDGVDAAFLETDGEKIVRFGPSMSFPITIDDRDSLQAATQAALKWRFDGVPPNNLLAAEHVVHLTHINAVKQICEAFPSWSDRLDLIGFHGQTVLHHPPAGKKPGQTLQLGAGQILADCFGVPCVYDFRSDDMREGGQGAPLAPVYHKALIDHSNLSGPICILNLGGVGNITYVDGSIIAATDTGPANGPLDNWMRQHDLAYDQDGQHSMRGTVHFDLIEKWFENDFFYRPTPRSADRYTFEILPDVQSLSLDDGAATLCAFSALAVKRSLMDLGGKPEAMIVCGGGRHNHGLMQMLKAEHPFPVNPAENAGWNSDMIEAQAFAYLAVRSLKGMPISFPETTGVPYPMTGGVVAYPASSNLGSRGGA